MKPAPDYQGLIRHVQVEHQKLETLLVEVQAALVDWQHQWASRAAFETARGKTVQLAGEAYKHFDEEENEGCMEEAVCHCPSLAADVACVRKEHTELKQDLGKLIALVDKNSQNAQEVLNAFAQLKQKLHEHEKRENELIEHAFGECIAEENGFKPPRPSKS